MTITEAVAAIDALAADDPDMSHSMADGILLAVVAPEVAEAYRRLVKRCSWWATA